MTITQSHPLILASGSSIRQQMLKSVGLTFSVVPSGVEEDAIKAQMLGVGRGHDGMAAAVPPTPQTGDAIPSCPPCTIPELALALARAKTLSVSSKNPHAYTIGADQICALGTRILSKPGSYDRAEAQLAELSGKTHMQHCAITLAKGDQIIWEFHEAATLTMRDLTPAEIKAYVAADAPLQSCGAYKFEGLGRYLFSKVEGDHDVVQGLALVPLLTELQKLGVVKLA